MVKVKQWNALFNQVLLMSKTTKPLKYRSSPTTLYENHVSPTQLGSCSLTTPKMAPLGIPQRGFATAAESEVAPFSRQHFESRFGRSSEVNPSWISVLVGATGVGLVFTGILSQVFMSAQATQVQFGYIGEKIDALATTTQRQIDALAATTQRQIDALAETTQRQIATLAADTKSQFAAQAADIKALAADTKSQFATQTADIREQIKASVENEEKLNQARFVLLKDEMNLLKDEMKTINSKLTQILMDREK